MSAVPLIAGRFEVHEVIGHGSMSDVYRGVDQETRLPVAIKALKRDAAELHPVLIERFAHEGEALRRLNHPGIARVYATLEEDGQSFIIMEYIGGGTLRDLMLREPQLPIDTVLKIGMELADALSRAHHLNIIHRDLKSSNVMLTEQGHPKLADFGIARIGDATPITETGVVLGTYAYLSPEACYGEQMDARSDLWSFGVMLYEMVAGERPFQEESIGALITAILSKPVPDLANIRPDAPNALMSLIYMMLEKNRSHRIASARLVSAQLERIQQTRFPVASGEVAVLADATPTPSLLLATPIVPNNLPQRATPFLGRELELRNVHEMLVDPDCRLLTLTGPGGIGKTRLALQSATENMSLFPDGVCFVALEHLISRGRIFLELADALSFQFYDDRDPRQQIHDYLRDKRMLLIFDNFEHLLDGVDIVSDLLAHTLQVKVLATSRERLNLQSEWLYEVGGMQVPEELSTSMESYSAIRLFIQHAQRVDPDFTLSEADKGSILRICQLTEGMPLSIELAASWMRTLSPAELAGEIAESVDILSSSLRDVPERHRSLRAVFEYSWRLLSKAERDIFMRLSVFQGSFRRDAARAITGATPMALSNLVDKSLIRARPHSYEILPTLRHYAVEKLNEHPQVIAELRPRFCEYYVEFLSRQQAALTGANQKKALDEIANEIDNVRAAWQWSAELGRMRDFDCSLHSLFLFDEMRSWFAAGKETFGLAIEAARAAGDASVLGRLLARQGVFAYMLGQMEQASVLVNEAHALVREQGNLSEIGFCSNRLGRIAYLQGRYDEAAQHFEAAQLMASETASLPELAFSLTHTGLIAYHRSRYREAQQAQQRAMNVLRELGNQRDLANCMRHLGTVMLSLGEYSEARSLFQQSLAINDDLGDRMGVSLNLNNLGMLAFEQGNIDEARAFHEDSLAVKRQIGNWRGVAFSLNNLGLVAYHQADYGQARQLLEEGLQISREMGEERAIANILSNLGDVSHATQDYSRARRLYQESILLKETLGDRAGIAHSQHKAGLVALDQQIPAEAEQRFQESLAYYQEIGHQRGIAESLAALGWLFAQTGQDDRARDTLREALSLAREIQALPVALDVLTALASLASAAGDYERAAELLALPLIDVAATARTRQQAEAEWNRLDVSAWATARARGAARTLTEVVDDALQGWPV